MKIEKAETRVGDIWILRLTREEALATIAKLAGQMNDSGVGSITLRNEFDGCRVDLGVDR